MAVHGGLLLGALGMIAGCSTPTGTGARSERFFNPPPSAQEETSEFEPVAPRSVTELLQDAEAALATANEAQERGDTESALRHYTLMLELLAEADLDPAVFYSLREQFGSILEATAKHARRYESLRLEHLEKSLAAEGSYGDIQMPNPLPERVLAEVEMICTGYPKNFQAGMDRSYRYLPYIKDALRKERLPEDLAYLPMVESLFTPKIMSRAGAGGMWQFMRSTGRRYHLRIDSHVDERYNWHSATHAAIAYLKDLHDYFDGSWPLAITAYNMGEFGLERAIAANGGERNFWRLIATPPAANRIRLETKNYYPRFLATLIVMRDPERYGFQINPQPPENTVRVPVSGMYALDDLDAALGLPSGSLAQLNPDLLQEITPPSGESAGGAPAYAVAVPAEHRERFLAALNSVPQLKYGGRAYTVRRGDTVAKIARRYGVSEKELVRLNSIRHPRRLQIGQSLRIPGYATARGGDAPANSASRNSDDTYIVRPGDTLHDIASAHGVTVEELRRWNGLRNQATIFANDTLHVTEPGSAAAAATPNIPAEKQYYTVKAGDVPGKIASAHGISLDDFLKWNRLTTKSTIRVGDKVVVGVAAPEKALEARTAADERKVAAAVRATERAHVVDKGDTAGAIAARYGVSTHDLLAWNGLNAKSVLRIGQRLRLEAPAAGVSDAPKKITRAADSVEKTVHVVAKGQNPTTIARRYDVRVSDLYKWNNWPDKHVLQIGDKVVIYKN